MTGLPLTSVPLQLQELAAASAAHASPWYAKPLTVHTHVKSSAPQTACPQVFVVTGLPFTSVPLQLQSGPGMPRALLNFA